MKKENKKVLGIFIVLLSLTALFFYSSIFSLLSGQASPFIFEKRICEQEQYCSLPEGCACRDNGVVAYYKGGGNGDNTVYGYIDTIPKCGYYTADYSMRACPSTNGNSEITLYMNNNIIGYAKTSADYNTRRPTVTNLDVTNIVNGAERVDVKFRATAVDGNSGDSLSCEASLETLSIKAYECEGDKYFVRGCPLFEGYTVKGIEFKSNSTIKMSDLPSDAYFCQSTPVLIKDYNNKIIGNTYQPYIDVSNGLEVIVPDGQSYIFILMTSSSDTRVQELDNIISGLNMDLAEKIEYIKNQQLTIDQYKLLISEREATLSNMVLIAEELQLKVEEFDQLIKQYEIRLLNSQAKVEEMKSLNEQLLLDYIKLQESATNRAALLEMAYQSNAELGEALSQVRLENQEYADILNLIADTITDDKEILTNMDLTNENLIDIISKLKLDYDNMKSLVNQMSTNLEEQKVLNAQLDAKLKELEALNTEIIGLNEQLKLGISKYKVALIIVSIAFIGLLILYLKRK